MREKIGKEKEMIIKKGGKKKITRKGVDLTPRLEEDDDGEAFPQNFCMSSI